MYEFLRLGVQESWNPRALSRGTLEVRRDLLRHTLYLEKLTHQLAADWSTYRRRRWPASTNPHLLVSQKAAVDPDHPAVNIELRRGALPAGRR
ncbi:hypothetical protein [Streptomyces sp. Ag109_G2-15]|uniref:hypothetical protein n=1 Tax=Streptomyces sp. Ag109_G2-15 TaxID=1938850 RepID=UPI0026A022C4|nr:hypothetical protein [Streptomyces sp. Ag109_G2-15]